MLMNMKVVRGVLVAGALAVACSAPSFASMHRHHHKAPAAASPWAPIVEILKDIILPSAPPPTTNGGSCTDPNGGCLPPTG